MVREPIGRERTYIIISYGVVRVADQLMTENVGGYDRIGRFIVGPALIIVAVAAFAGVGPIAEGSIVAPIVALLIGGVITYTAVVRYCRFNGFLGIDTVK